MPGSPSRRFGSRPGPALATLLILAGTLITPPPASAALDGTATTADDDRPRTDTFATSLDEGFTSTTRVLMRTLDAGTDDWREWGLELGQSEDYDTADVAARELLLEGTGVMANGLTGYDYSRRTSNGSQSRNAVLSGATTPTTFGDDGEGGEELVEFSTRENGGLLVELSFVTFSDGGDGLLDEAPIADAEFRIEILTRATEHGGATDDDFRLATLNELLDTAIGDQGLDAALEDRLYPRRADVDLFHCDPLASSACAAETASDGGTFDPVIDDAAATTTGVTGSTQTGIAQAFMQANGDGKAWLWLKGPTNLDFMLRVYDRRTDEATDDFNTITTAALDGEGALVTTDPLPDSRVVRVFSEQVGYAFDGSNPSPTATRSDSRRETNFFAKRDDEGSTLLNYRSLLPDAPIDVYAKEGGGTTTSTFNCVRNDSDICVRPEPPIVPVVFNGAAGDWEGGYSADANDAYFPYNDHGAVGIYEFVPNCDGLDLSASTLTVDQNLVAYQTNDGSGGADGDAPQTTVRAQLYNSCGDPYRGPSRTFNISVPDEANPGSSKTVSVTTNSRGLATTTVTAPLNNDGNDASATGYSDNVSTDFGTDGDDTTTTVNFFGPNTPSVANSTLTMLKSTATADDSDVTTAVVQLRNIEDAAVGAGTRVCLSFSFEPAEGVSENAWSAPVPPGEPTPDYWETDATGRVEVDMPSPTTGTVTVTAADDPCGSGGTVADGDRIGGTDGVTGTYSAGDADAGEADIEISDEQIEPDGASTSTVTVTVRDANGNPVGAGQSVCLETVGNADGTDSTGTLSSGPWTTDANGQVTATVTSPTEEGAATVYGWLGTCGSKAGGIGSVGVSYVDAPPPADPAGPLVCSPDPASPGRSVECTLTGGDPEIDYLWRASFLGQVFATTVMTTLADGSGSFTFVVPAEAACEDILVELVDWNISTVFSVVCPPTSIAAGGGTDASSGTLALLASLLLGTAFLGRLSRTAAHRPAR